MELPFAESYRIKAVEEISGKTKTKEKTV